MRRRTRYASASTSRPRLPRRASADGGVSARFRASGGGSRLRQPMVDHLFDPPPPYRVVLMEPLTSLALGVRAAKRVSLETGILVPPFRHPVLTAKALATWVSRQRATSSFNLNMDDNLLRYQDNPTAIVPWLAETHEVVNAGRRWTFHLRHRVKPHDGSEASAEAVRFSFESLLALERFALRCSSVCG